MFRLWIFIATLFAAICGCLSTTNPDLTVNRQCEPIRIELCKGIGYNETSMPNLVGHELQTDADFTLQTFSPLIQYGCSAQLHFFLCAAYVPMCTPKVPVPIGPCRGLCETIRARCFPVLQGFGFPWPSALDCNRFPEVNNHEHMCMEGPGEPSGGPVPGNGLTMPASKIPNHFYAAGSGTCQDLVKSHLYARLNRTGRCAPLCEADIMFDQQEKHLAEVWVTAWSVTALFTAIVATLCLIFTDTRQDKILMPLVICHLLVAVGWTVRWLAKRNPTACGFDPQLPGVSLLLIDGLSNAPCAATFLLRYYFGMAACVWWAILCLKWQLAVRRTRCEQQNVNQAQSMLMITDRQHGSTLLANNHSNLPVLPGAGGAGVGAVQGPGSAVNNNNTNLMKIVNGHAKYTNYNTLIAWGIPALQTVAVLVARFVDADELLGSCFVGNQSDKALRLLVAMPLFCFWIFGSVNLFVGYLLRPQQCGAQPVTTKKGQQQRNSYLPESMDGMGTFLFSYCVPSALLMISVFYEFANRDLWLNVPQPSSEPVSAIKAPMWPFMTRAFMELLLGVIASAWALGPRAINFWKSKTPPGNKNVAQMGQMMKPIQTYANVQGGVGGGPGSVVGGSSAMVQYQLAQPLLQQHVAQQQQQQQQHQLHQQQMMTGGSSGFVSGSHYTMNKFNPSSYPAVSYQTVCQAPSSYLSATGSMPRQYHRKYGHGQSQSQILQQQQQQQQQMLLAQQQQQQQQAHHHHHGQHPQQSRKMRNSNYKMTLSQSISLTGNETIL